MEKITVGQVVMGALWIFIMTLVDMFYSYTWTPILGRCVKTRLDLRFVPHTCPMPVHNIANTNAHIAHNNGTCNGETARAHSVCAILTNLTE